MIHHYKVKISKSMKEEAKELASKMIKMAFIHNCKHVFTVKSQSESIYNGFLGQIVYRKYLLKTFYQFTERLVIDGRGDGGIDFIVKGNKVDVKTSKMQRLYEDTAWNNGYFFLLNRYQVNKLKSDLFACVQLSKNYKIGYVMGHITPKEAIEFGIKHNSEYSQNFNVLFSDLYMNIEVKE